MSRNKKRKGKKTNILLGFICIILVGVLGTILVMSYNTEQEEAKRLTELAGNQQSGIEDYEAVKEHAAQLEKASSEDDNTEDADNSETKKSKKKEDTAGEEDAEETFLYIGYNFYMGLQVFALPKLPKGKHWYQIMDTAQMCPFFKEPRLLKNNSYEAFGQTISILVGR